MKRSFDIVLSAMLLVLFALPMLLITLAIKLTSRAGFILVSADRPWQLHLPDAKIPLHVRRCPGRGH